MAALIEKVANLAYKTFADFSHTNSLTVVGQKLPALKGLVGFVTSKDVVLDDRLVTSTGPFNLEYGVGAPVTYMHLWEDKVLSIGVFIVKHGMSIPLHDHPMMYGLIKVLHGTMHVTSFSQHSCEDERLADKVLSSLPPSQRRLVRCVDSLPEAMVDKHSDPCVLTPTIGNYHEITAVDGPMAFLDILAPPYDHDPQSRECHYYRELDIANIQSQGEQSGERCRISCLVPVGQPNNFWCDSAVYRGPKLRPNEEQR
ncbi:hypothetical protein LSH36_769g00110 [Paralvinella palmiformis]|uniref:2-aminoethanethiol dioxygenase n=1 Tax=Paralvinella palmiformis TaxID=53620 RepID=A0AAD9MVA6_9ANNE|nr:hypothetical protein LSH36_769g00110 [Paralvinella palmiformis]